MNDTLKEMKVANPKVIAVITPSITDFQNIVRNAPIGFLFMRIDKAENVRVNIFDDYIYGDRSSQLNKTTGGLRNVLKAVQSRTIRKRYKVRIDQKAMNYQIKTGLDFDFFDTLEEVQAYVIAVLGTEYTESLSALSLSDNQYVTLYEVTPKNSIFRGMYRTIKYFH